MTTLFTSLQEIKDFKPCQDGWNRALAIYRPLGELIPLREFAVVSTFADFCWLLGKRKTEIAIAVRAAVKCANSVPLLKHTQYAARFNQPSVAYIDAAAHTAAAAADAAAYAVRAADDDAGEAAMASQRAKNMQFLLEEIASWEAAI